MKITYDGHIFRLQKVGGIRRYHAEVIRRLDPDWRIDVFGVAGFGTDPIEHPHLTVHDGPRFRPNRVSRLARRLRWEIQFARSGNVFHPTYYILSDGLRLDRIKCPIVVTVHDMIMAAHPDWFAEAGADVPAQTEAVLRASHVICVSQATERDLLDRIPQAAGKTSVIYHGSSFGPGEGRQNSSAPEHPSFIYVGSRNTYKNFPFLLSAFARASRSVRNLRLKIVGPPLSYDERWQLHRLGITDRVDLFVFPGERELRQLYQDSTALLYPSLLEGFGLPPLEAMAGGTVAVTSNTTSLPEVVGDGGIMLDPTKEEDWTECIVELSRGKIDRQVLIDRGLRQAARFSWDKTASQHREIYKRFS